MDRRQNGAARWAIAGAVALAAVAGASTARAASVKSKTDLAPTAADADARGKVQFVLKNADDGKLVVRVGRLAPDASFDLLADGVKVGTIETTGGGGGRIRLRSAPRGNDELLGFDPRGAVLTVRDANGDDVLAGTVSDDTIEDGKIACCIPDDSGAECEDRTEADCAAQGGTVTTSNTCLPNPCTDVPVPGMDVVCCIPDDGGAECEDRTEADCAAQGGTVVDATSCDPNPCAATPPAEDEIACCVPHGGEPAECETTSPDACTALGGTATAATSCTPDPCAENPGPTPTPTVTPNPDDTPTPGATPDDHGGPGGGGNDG